MRIDLNVFLGFSMNNQTEYNFIDHIVFLLLIPALVVMILAREIAIEAGFLPEPPTTRERLHQKLISSSMQSMSVRQGSEEKTMFYNRESVIYR